jgi:mRNA-degrading endonuclease toxin of MazEF toxin-antitoxin module
LTPEAYPRGTVVLVPFPFTDLSGRKRRPALVVSPEGFHEDDLILCAVTSQIPEKLSEWEVLLEAKDIVEEELPKRSVIKVGKLFAMPRSLIASRFGSVRKRKLSEVLERLQGLFAEAVPEPKATHPAEQASPYREEEIDESVLALLYLNTFKDHGVTRAWKSFDWDAMDRLYEKGLISDPKSKAKSVVLTDEGLIAAEEAFRKLFAT